MDRDAAALLLAEAARLAASALTASRGCGDARAKADGSPVCSADIAADHAAKDALARLLPGLPVISEESPEEAAAAETFVLLDPLDGTREFLAGGDGYCVAIALVRAGRPVAGAIAAPALGRCWHAGAAAFERRLSADGGWDGSARPVAVRAAPDFGPTVLVSRFHGDPRSEAIVDALGPGARQTMSSAVKFGLIASGEADLNVRCGATMAWDVAAGDAILAAAGGALIGLDGAAIDYRAVGAQGWRNPPFVAAGSVALARRAVAAAI